MDKAIDNLKGYDIDSLIVIGGDGSYRGDVYKRQMLNIVENSKVILN